MKYRASGGLLSLCPDPIQNALEYLSVLARNGAIAVEHPSNGWIGMRRSKGEERFFAAQSDPFSGAKGKETIGLLRSE